MNSAADRYARVGTILGGARGLRGAGLAAYLDSTCGGDASVRAEIDELLALSGDDDQGAALAEADLEGTRRALEGLVDSATRPWLPDEIGQYRILRRLGQGGMGVVYEAEQAAPRRRVAIKLLHPMQATPDRLRRFRREAEMLGRLQHPGIASIFEAGTYDLGRGPQPFFAMELVEGVDIRAHCERRRQARALAMGSSPTAEGACRRASPEIIELLARTCDAVHFAHEQGIVHRDLKPDNVLIDRHGQPRVLDFGIASTIDPSAMLSSIATAEGQMVGTLAYMAPELLRRSASALTRQVDVYALGVMGFELLVGRLPREIEGLSLPQAIEWLSSSEPLHASAFDPSLRGDLETILDKALESEPAYRYASAAALASDLRRHLADQPIQARPQSRFYRARKFTRRHPGLVGGGVATLLVALAGTFMALRSAHEARMRANELERTAYRMTIARANVAVQQQDYAAAATTLDQAPAAHRNWEYDHLRAKLVQHIDEWEAPAPLTTAPVFDLAGRRMFALMFDGTIGTWDTSSGQRLASLALDGDSVPPRARVGAAVLNGPSLRFAALSADGDVVIGDLETGARSCVLPGPAAVHAWDPAGRRLLYWAGVTRLWDGTRSQVLTDEASSHGAFDHAGERIALASGRRIALFDATTGERLCERTLDDQILDLAFAPDDETLAAAGYYRNAYLLDGRTLDVDERLVGHRDIVHSVTWNEDGSRLITASADRTVRIWDIRRLGSSVVCTSDAEGDSTACVLPDGEHVLVVGERVRRFPLQDPNVLRGHTSFVYHLAFSPDGSMLASSGYREPVVHVWDLDLGRSLWRLLAPRTGEGGHFGQAPVVAFSADGRRLVAASSAETLNWDVRTGSALAASSDPEPVARFFQTLGHSTWGAFGGRAISADGKRGARCNECVVEVFDVPDGSPGRFQQEDPGLSSFTITGRLTGHVGKVYCVALSPDELRVATGGNDGTVRIWDARTGEDLLVLRGHEQYVIDVAFSPDGTRLASASGDATIRLWDTKPLHVRRAQHGR